MNSLLKNITLNSALILGACTILVAIVVQGQYGPMGGSFDSDSNSENGPNVFLSRSELEKIMRNSQKPMAASSNHYNNGNQQAATRNLYNRQQPLQYAQSHHQGQNYGPTDGLSGYGPMMGAPSGRSNANNEDRDDDDGPNTFGPAGGFGPSSFGPSDDGESSGADGPVMNLKPAASGYGMNHGNQGYGNDQSNLGASFGGGYNNAGEGDEASYGQNHGNGFASQSKRSKSASTPMRSNEYDGNEDDAPASRYGPNSASNSDRDPDDDSRGYSPDSGRDNDNDDE